MLEGDARTLMTPTEIARRSGWSLRAVQMWFEDGLPNVPVRTRGGMGRGASWEDVEAYLRRTGREIKKRANGQRGKCANEEGRLVGGDGSHGESGASGGSGASGDAGGMLAFDGGGRSETQVAAELERRIRQAIDQLMPVDALTGRVRLHIDGSGDADRITGAIRKLSGEARLLAEHRQGLEERNKEFVARGEVAAAWARFGTTLVAELAALSPDLARDLGAAAAGFTAPERADELKRTVAALVTQRTNTLRERIAAGLRAGG